ncbi:helix-turn-helix domain-containing protein, partial [Massilia sp. CT11-108]|uniref:helix-turn-helix domain-containing protein n=1 Tax=Massilia sp. CT11-108 TaxID=3393900 RepID=UPI0039A4E9C2
FDHAVVGKRERALQHVFQLAHDALPSNLPDYLSQVERDIILRALNQTQFNRTQAASLLGISVRQLRYQMQKLDIHAPEP